MPNTYIATDHTPNQSREIKNLFIAIAKAQGEMNEVVKDKENSHLRSKYASLAALIRASRPALSKYGLSVLQQTFVDPDGTLVLITKLCHSSGEWIQSLIPITPQRKDEKSIGSFLTYMERYSYSALVGVIIPDDDTDNDGTSYQKNSYQENTNYQQNTHEKQKEHKITKEQLLEITSELNGYPNIKTQVIKALGIASIAFMNKNDFERTIVRIKEIKKELK